MDLTQFEKEIVKKFIDAHLKKTGKKLSERAALATIIKEYGQSLERKMNIIKKSM